MDLTRFLTARLDEDEVAATPGRHALDDLRFDLKLGDSYEQRLSSRIEDGLDIQTGAWQARVLREVEAKRKILAEAQAVRKLLDLTGGEHDRYRDWVLRHLAAVYQDHPDFDPAWKD